MTLFGAKTPYFDAKTTHNTLRWLLANQSAAQTPQPGADTSGVTRRL